MLVQYVLFYAVLNENIDLYIGQADKKIKKYSALSNLWSIFVRIKTSKKIIIGAAIDFLELNQYTEKVSTVYEVVLGLPFYVLVENLQGVW